MYEQQNNRPQDFAGGQTPQQSGYIPPENKYTPQNQTIYAQNAYFAGRTPFQNTAATPFYQNVTPIIPIPTPEEKEKKEITKKALLISISFLILEALTGVISVLLFVVLGIFGFTDQKQTELLSNPAFMQFYQIVVSITVFLVPFIVSYKILKYRISDIVSFKKPKKGTAFPLFLIGIACCVLANLLTNQASALFEKSGIEYNVDFGDSPQGFFGVLLSILATVVTAALVEEFVCRGLVMGLLKKHGEGFAIVVSAILFGLMHQNFIQIPFATLIGLILGYVTIKTGSLWVAIAIHAFNNGISVLFDYLPFSAKLSNFSYYILMVVVLFAGIVGLYLIKSNTEIFKLEKGKTNNSFKKNTKTFCLCPTVLLFAGFCLFSSFQFFF